MDYKYDIEIVTPISFQKKYKKRFLDFKKYGLLNTSNNNILLTVLVWCGDKVEEEEIKSNLPPNVDCKIIYCPKSNVSAKTYYYYSQYSDFQSRWIAKFDDDSITDIGRLIEQLDYNYSHNGLYYLVTTLHEGLHEIETSLVKSLGYNWFQYHPPIYHEYEGCVVSVETLRTIMSCESAVKLMKLRSEIEEEDGPNDVCLACAAKMVKIYATKAQFLINEPIIADFTCFNGPLSHIHFVSHDNREQHAFQILKNQLLNPTLKEKEIQFTKNNWLLRGTIDEELIFFEIKLLPNRKILTFCDGDYLLSIWSYKEEKNELHFYDGCGGFRLKFKEINNKWVSKECSLSQIN